MSPTKRKGQPRILKSIPHLQWLRPRRPPNNLPLIEYQRSVWPCERKLIKECLKADAEANRDEKAIHQRSTYAFCCKWRKPSLFCGTCLVPPHRGGFSLDDLDEDSDYSENDSTHLGLTLTTQELVATRLKSVVSSSKNPMARCWSKYYC
jgi:hypothetical protein